MWWEWRCVNCLTTAAVFSTGRPCVIILLSCGRRKSCSAYGSGTVSRQLNRRRRRPESFAPPPTAALPSSVAGRRTTYRRRRSCVPSYFRLRGRAADHRRPTDDRVSVRAVAFTFRASVWVYSASVCGRRRVVLSLARAKVPNRFSDRVPGNRSSVTYNIGFRFLFYKFFIALVFRHRRRFRECFGRSIPGGDRRSCRQLYLPLWILLFTNVSTCRTMKSSVSHILTDTDNNIL